MKIGDLPPSRVRNFITAFYVFRKFALKLTNEDVKYLERLMEEEERK